MTGLDVIVIIIVGVAAAGGFMRGLAQEVLSLASWILAAFSIYYLHSPLTAALGDLYTAEPATSILAFALLLLIPYAAMKLIAGNVAGSILGPVDRVLGFGFGAVKGALIFVFAFSLLVIGFDSAWGYKGRPGWIVGARSYPIADASSRKLVNLIAQNRAALREQSEAEEEANGTKIEDAGS